MSDDPLKNDLTKASREAYGRYSMPDIYPRGLLKAIADAGREASRQQIIADGIVTPPATTPTDAPRS